MIPLNEKISSIVVQKRLYGTPLYRTFRQMLRRNCMAHLLNDNV